MQNDRQTLDLFSYSSVRPFLKAYAEIQKNKNPNWSYGMWARKLGLKGTASLTMVINGQRNPGQQMIASLAQYFKFNQKEKQYFENLANLDKVQKDSSLELLVLKELKRLSPTKDFKFFDESAFEVISQWYHLAIKQLVRIGARSPETIASRLRHNLSERQIKTALQNLENVGLIKLSDEGYVLNNGPVNTGDDVPSEAIKKYHEQSIENAKSSVREVPISLRELQSLVLAFDESKLEDAKKMIREFTDEFSKLMDASSGKQVYQLNIQFFPLTKEIKNETKNKEQV